MDSVEKDPLEMWADILEQTIVRGTCQAPSVSCVTLLWNWDLKLKTGSWNYMTMQDGESSISRGVNFKEFFSCHRKYISTPQGMDWNFRPTCSQLSVPPPSQRFRYSAAHFPGDLVSLHTATLPSPSLQFIKEQKLLSPEIRQCSLTTGLLGSGVV